MNIETLEIKLLKSSQIEDGDIIVVKMDEEVKKTLTKQDIRNIYESITNMINRKDIGIYFFPKHFDLEIMTTHVNNLEMNKKEIEEKVEESNNE